MARLHRDLAAVLAAILCAHALTYFLVTILPDAAILALGIEGTRQEVMAAFHAQHVDRSYSRVVLDLIHFEFGQTLDGTPVRAEIFAGVIASAPRVLSAFTLVLATALCAVLLPPTASSRSEHVASFIAFLPPYVLPFLGIVTLLSATFIFGLQIGDTIKDLVAIVSLAAAPAALIFVQTRNISKRNLTTEFARTLLAVGGTPLYQRWRLRHNAFAEIVPSLEKVLTALVAVLLFLEPIFVSSGFGTTVVRAIKRSDTDLILGVTLVTAIGVGICRIITIVIRRCYGMTV